MIRFAVVGLGFIGKRHIEMIRRNPEAELVAVCDLIDYSKDYDVPFFQASYQMIDEVKPDVVCVCTHNSDHHTTAIHALQRGCHVLIEKPMGVESSLSECQLNRFLKSYPQDLLMFGWVESVKRNMPSVKIRDAIRQYLDWANIDGDIGAHEVTYYRMATKLRESEKTT